MKDLLTNWIARSTATLGALSVLAMHAAAQTLPPSVPSSPSASPMINGASGAPEPATLAIGGVAAGAYFLYRKLRTKRES
jgi:hypothetical protein